MSVDLEPVVESYRGESQEITYRRLSPSAVAAVVVGALAWVAMLDWIMVVVPLVGVAVALYAMRTIRSRSDELTGVPLAKTGLILSAMFLLVGPSVLAYERIHELPEGYTRIDYGALQPNPDHPGEAIPASAMELQEQKVFIKGYIYPGRDPDGIRQFLLVRDQGDCCFGGNPKITDRIQVTLADPERLTYATHLHKVAGTFRVVKRAQAVDGVGGIFYELNEAHLR